MACDTPIYVLPKYGIEKVPIPCGRCPPCKLRRVNNWVFRLLQEEKVSQHAHFVTLTYDTDFVPISDNGFMTLRKKDLQNYFKRLRKLLPDSNIKYYACGEYGSKNKRPHYHAIFFNVPESKYFAEAWGLGGKQFGNVHVGKVTGDSIAYTMKYIDKSQFGYTHTRDDREREFPLMSKGLGKSFLTDQMVDYYQSDITRMHVTREGGHRSALPRYYRKKIFSDEQMKQQRHHVAAVMAKEKALDMLEFERMGYPETYTYDMWKSSQKLGRYDAFQANIKNRDI